MLVLSAKIAPRMGSYASLPVLVSPNPYRILTENVTIDIKLDDQIKIVSTTVFRNMGGGSTGRLVFSDGSMAKPAVVSASWDNKPISIQPMVGKNGKTMTCATVPLGAQATHALRLTVSGMLAKSGYAKDQYIFHYRLAGSQPIGLFSLSYRYRPGSIFGLPKVEPDLGWEVGPKGASIRKTDFNPGNTESTIEFYRNAMNPLGAR
jgi:hypothetical protein